MIILDRSRSFFETTFSSCWANIKEEKSFKLKLKGRERVWHGRLEKFMSRNKKVGLMIRSKTGSSVSSLYQVGPRRLALRRLARWRSWTRILRLTRVTGSGEHLRNKTCIFWKHNLGFNPDCHRCVFDDHQKTRGNKPQ